MKYSKSKISGTKQEHLNELIQEATIDCYDVSEEFSGIMTMLEDNVTCPFQAKIIGETVEVMSLEWPDYGNSVKAVCKNKNKKYTVDIGSFEWIEPLPEGFEWIEAYFQWYKTIG